MVALPQQNWTPEAYLAFERASEEKHEYLAGEIFLMTGASRRHNLITGNVMTTLNAQLKGRNCEVYASDMRVWIPALDSYTYPDIAIVCGLARFEDDQVDTLLNPTVVVEVLSPTTEVYDRGRKFHAYRTLPSLREYLLISQDRGRIERYLRQDDGLWLFSDTTLAEAVLELPSVGCTLAMADVYDKVTFEDDPA